MSATQNLALIVCMDANGGIGKGNKLPWRIPEDMRHFRETTTGHIVVMGRKTFESVGRPLPNRINIVLSRSGYPPPADSGVIVTTELRHALSIAGHAPEKNVFIIGGAEIYAQALGVVHELIVTRLNEAYDCDTFFPPRQAEEWEALAAQTIPTEHTASGIITIVRYKRRQTANAAAA